MKKVLGLSMLAVMLLAAGCSKDDSSSANGTQSVSSEADDMQGDDISSQDNSTEGTKTIISKTPINKTFDVKPFKVTIDSISLVNMKGVSDEMRQDMNLNGIEGLEQNQVSFNYMDIKYHIENTSSETAIFRGLQEVIFVVDGKQENLDMFNNNQDFIQNDEEDQGGGEYLGHVNKKGEAGLIVQSDPKKIKHIRLTIGDSMKEVGDSEYEGIADQQEVEFDLK